MRQLPQVDGLREAVERVISSNKKDGYPPTRFIQITEGGYAADLHVRCASLIDTGETLAPIERALQRIPTLLTLEDFVARVGLTWGFSSVTVDTAKQRVQHFDSIAGEPRYE